jgi:hypothetical protein
VQEDRELAPLRQVQALFRLARFAFEILVPGRRKPYLIGDALGIQARLEAQLPQPFRLSFRGILFHGR